MAAATETESFVPCGVPQVGTCLRVLHEALYVSTWVGGFEFKILKPGEFISESLVLQAEILDDLAKKGQTGFIIEKDGDHFAKMRDGVHGITVGIFNGNGKLVGQTCLNFQDLSARAPYNQHGLSVPEGTKVFECQGTMVHPSCRGAGIAETMHGILLNACGLIHGAANVLLVAEIAANNGINLNSRVNKCGFLARVLYTAPDGVDCYLCFKPACVLASALPLSSLFADKQQICPLRDTTQIDKLLRHGYSISQVVPVKEDGRVVGTNVVMGQLKLQYCAAAYKGAGTSSSLQFNQHGLV